MKSFTPKQDSVKKTKEDFKQEWNHLPENDKQYWRGKFAHERKHNLTECCNPVDYYAEHAEAMQRITLPVYVFPRQRTNT